jgi:hypothetical protein
MTLSVDGVFMADGVERNARGRAAAAYRPPRRSRALAAWELPRQRARRAHESWNHLGDRHRSVAIDFTSTDRLTPDMPRC